MKPDILYREFDFKAAGDGSLEGLCAVFHNIDSYGEIVDDTAFDQDLDFFLKDGFVGGLNHDWDHPIGKPMDAKKQRSGLWVKGRISDTDHGRECRKLMQDGVIKKLSIGYRRLGRLDLANADECMGYWEGKGYTPNADDLSRAPYGATVLIRAKLYEFSPVTMPANDLAAITAVKTDDMDGLQSLRDAEEYLRDAGRFSRREAKALISHLKTLLRDAESEEPTGAITPDVAQDEVTPAIDAEPDLETKEGETPPETPPAPDITPIVGLPDSLLRTPTDPVLPALKAQQQRIAAALYQQYLKTGAR